jgi:hypothetical protein
MRWISALMLMLGTVTAAAAQGDAESALVRPGPGADTTDQFFDADALGLAIRACWLVEPGSEAARVTVTVGFDLDREGRVVDAQVRLLHAQDGPAEGVVPAFQAAQRAVLRCQGAGGYDLPLAQYGLWRQVELTFDPTGLVMR